MKKEFVCIVCPSSCRLTVEEVDGNITVTGNTCKRGLAHGTSEFTNPTRMLTTTVSIDNAIQKRLSVVSTGELPKSQLPECLQHLYSIKLTAPVVAGDVVVANILGSGVDIVAAHSLASTK